LRAEPVAGEGLDQAEGEPAHQRAGHGAEAADHADHECLAEEEAGDAGGDGEDDGHQRAAGPGHQRADAERDGVHLVHADAHQRRRIAVHAHRDDGAADLRGAHHRVEHAGEHERQHHRHHPVERQDHPAQVDAPQVQHHAPRRGGEPEVHEVVQDHVQPEGQRQRGEHRLHHHAVDHQVLDQVADQEQDDRHRHHRDDRAHLEVQPGEERDVAAQHDERAVHHVDDVQHAPDERKADRDSRIHRADHEAVGYDLSVIHAKPAVACAAAGQRVLRDGFTSPAAGCPA
jgi:hypothetical protein